MKKNFALALALTLTLSATAPVFAFTRDGGGGRDRDLNPIQRVIKFVKKLLPPSLFDIIEVPHP